MSAEEGPQLDQQPGSVAGVSVDELVSSTARLLQLVESSSASRLGVSFGAVRWEIETAPPPAATVVTAPPATTVVAAPVDAAGAEAATALPPGHYVVAPVVGVFYTAPRPGAAPFVCVGSRVEEGQQLAIIEAMKMMNEIVADRSGVVRAVHAQENAVVEFGEPLFTLDPAS